MGRPDNDMEDIESRIPPALLARLVALKPLLETQGILQLHRSVYRLRYRAECDYGYLVHRSILIGADVSIVNAVEALLERWRADRQARDAEEARKQADARLEEDKEQVLANLFATLHGGSRQRQRQLREFFRECWDDPVKALHYLFSHQLPPPKKPGEPTCAEEGTSDGGMAAYIQNLQRLRDARVASP